MVPARKQPLLPMTRPLAGDSGFSLIELIVVVVIIGISVAIALPTVSGTFRTSDSQRLTVEAGRLWRAVTRYRSDAKGQMPDSVSSATLVHPITGESYLESWPVTPGAGGELSVGTGSGAAPPTTGAAMSVVYSVGCGGYCGWMAAYGQNGQLMFQRGSRQGGAVPPRPIG